MPTVVSIEKLRKMYENDEISQDEIIEQFSHRAFELVVNDILSNFDPFEEVLGG